MKQKKSKTFKTVLRIKNIILAVVIALLFLVIVCTMVTRLTGGTPSAFGYTLYRVSSGSMEPELKVGDVILTQACAPEEIKLNDIVTYTASSGSLKGKTITHRVVKAPYTNKGEKYIITKGDANGINDNPVKLSQIEGKFKCKVEILNALYSFFITPLGLLTLIALIVLAFFNEIVILVKAIAGIGYEDKKDSIDEIIARYQNESKEDSPNDDENSDNDIDSGG